jgi:uncharacterized protein YnzC (UPF0291/DUF896 family)
MKSKKIIGRIIALQDKKKSVGLTSIEEKEYCELNSKVTGLPKELFTDDFAKKVDSIIKKTDDLIEKLSK